LLSQNWPVLTFPHPILNNQNEVSSESPNKVIHKVTTLSFTPSFSGISKVRKYLSIVFIGFFCLPISLFDAQGSRVIIVIVQVGAVKIYL
jgi:hypothetical protein